MATERHLFDHSFKAAADLSASQHCIVRQTALDTVNLTTAATQRAVGVLKNKPKANEGATISMMGISKVKSDGSGTAIAIGDPLTSDASGRAVKAAATNPCIGWAMDPSSAANIVIRVFLVPGYVAP